MVGAVDERRAASGGELVAEVLEAHGVPALFTLCGGHISPILLGVKRRGVRVIDVRDEASAVFAADALARLTGTPGVAAVTAGPGVTNTVTAVKNAELAQSPVVLLGGAAATLLRGRGALQDIDQLALFRPHVKWAVSVKRLRDVVPTLNSAFRVAREGVPGPVFVELPVDVLYEEAIVRKWYAAQGGASGRSLKARALSWYLERHLARLFSSAPEPPSIAAPESPLPPAPAEAAVSRAASLLTRAQRPVLLVGSQATLLVPEIPRLVSAIERLGMPVFLSGMARGLLGPGHPLLLRHARGKALREADLVVLAGVPCDFRLSYGRSIARSATLVSANRKRADLSKNRRPSVAVLADPALFLIGLAAASTHESARFASWLEELHRRDDERGRAIVHAAEQPSELIDPLALCLAIDRALEAGSILVADGGDFVATASYIVSPRKPLAWLDPGPFGTLGVGAGFALGAKIAHPEAPVWILYGDGSSAYSLAEFDTFVRHGLPVIAVVGNDAAWTQIARGQLEILGDDVGTVLRRTAYHDVAAGYGGRGLLVKRSGDVPGVLEEAKSLARGGTPVLVNAEIGTTDFRSGSLSM